MEGCGDKRDYWGFGGWNNGVVWIFGALSLYRIVIAVAITSGAEGMAA